jgi:hypothetical protein
VLLACVTLAISVAGCGGGNESREAVTIASLPACAEASERISRPDALPADLPLPEGIVFTSSRATRPGETLISAVIPVEFRTAVKFFVERLPAAGYQLGEGDSEQDEAESFFAGQRVKGKWKVNGILNCADAVRLTLLVANR